MSTAADLLAAAKDQFESSRASSLSKRGLSAATKDHLAQLKDAFEASHSPISKRALSDATKEHLAQIKAAFETSHAPITKRALSESTKEHLAQIKDAFEASHAPLSKRDTTGSSAAQRLAAAKQGLEDAFSGAASSMVKRAEDDNDEPLKGNADMPVSNFQKTVVPLVIGLVLLVLFAAAASFVVYRKRIKNKATESASHRRKHLDLEDDGADEDYGYDLPQDGKNGRVQNVGFGANNDSHAGFVGAAPEHQGRKRTGSLNKEAGAKGDQLGEMESKEIH